MERMDELGFHHCQTPAYSPAYNGGIEETWAMGKKIIRNERYKSLIAGQKPNMNELINKAFKSLCI